MATNLLTTTHTAAPHAPAARRNADRRDWRREAKCHGDAGTDFYPPFGGERKRDRVAREQRAKAICATCPVSGQCLEQAIAAGERHGVWGGLTFDERRSFRRTA